MRVRYAALVVASCVLAYVAVGTQLASRQSATGDEIAHIAAGVAYVHGDTRLNREHPPLVKWLAGLMLADGEPLRLPAIVDGDTQWQVGHALLHRGPPEAVLERLRRARLPAVLLAALCPLLVAWFALRVAGPLAAVAAAGFAACSPLWYAHGTLVTTDAAVSVFTLGAALGVHAVLTEPAAGRSRWAWWLLLVACVALGVASKYSMLVSVAGLGLGALPMAIASRQPRRLFAVWLTLVLAALAAASLAWGLPPSLSAYVEGVRSVGFNHRAGYPFYAFGEFFLGVGSKPLYFAQALLVKVEWPVLLLGAVGLVHLAKRSKVDCALLAVVPALYLLVVSLRAPAIGVRYVLPVLPFMFVFAGVGVARLWSVGAGGRVAVWAAVALELLALVQALQTSPIAWFNGWPCRTGQTPACLDDSNVDWGHALPALAGYRDTHLAGQSLRVFSFVRSPLGAYLPRAAEADPREIVQPYRAVYAASLHLLARAPRSSPFAQATPTEVVAGAYAIFDLRSVAELPEPPR